MPETLRWLWRAEAGHPDALTKDNLKGDEALSKILSEDSKWELVGEGYGFTDAACSDAAGNFYFSDLGAGTLYRVQPEGGKPMPWLEHGPKISGLKPGPDGQLYAATQGTIDGGKDDKKKIIAIDLETKKITDLVSGVQPNDLVVSKAGWVYFTDTGKGEVVRVPTSARNMARPQTVAGGINKPNGISLSADQNFLIVSEYGGTNVWTFVVKDDGTIHSGERFMTLRTLPGKQESGGDGMTTDTQSRSYVTSLAGIQMFDWTGRLGGVIAKPNDKACVSVAFAGPQHDWFYACAADKVFRRKLMAQGAIFAGQ
jgi:enterochelin esterase family protein